VHKVFEVSCCIIIICRVLLSSFFVMGRVIATIVLFLAVGAFALPQKPSAKPAPKEPEAPATTSRPAPPKVPEKKVEKPQKPQKPLDTSPMVPDEKKMVVKKVVEKPVAKPDPKPPKKPEPKKEAPKKPEPKPEPKPEVKEPKPVSPATKKTCVEQTRDCLEKANWSYTKIANCTWNAGVCLSGRLGIEF